MKNRSLTLAEYQCLAEVRYQIRKYVRSSEDAARQVGLEPRQHQVLIAIKGIPDGVRPLIGEVADRLQIQHHSAVELVNRLCQGGYLRRQRDREDRREVLLELTPRAERVLNELADQHRQDITAAAPALVQNLRKSVRNHGNSIKARAATSRG